MTNLDALKLALEAMKERRSYCEQWEAKYGKEWDNEDSYIQSAIDKLEEEKKQVSRYGQYKGASIAKLEDVK